VYQLIRDRWRYQETLLTLCTAAFFVTMFGRLAISAVVPNVAARFDVSTSLIGTALTGMWLTYALAQFPSGIMAGRVGARLVILLSVAGTGLSTLVILSSPAFGVFALGTVLLGAAAGLHYSVATTLLTGTYDEIATAIGVHNSGGPIAGLVAPIVVSWVAVTFSWRLAVGHTLLIALLVGGLFVWKVRPTPPRHPDRSVRTQVDLGRARALLSRPSIAFTAVIAIVADFTWQGISSFLPVFFVQFHGYSQTMAGTLFAAYFLIQGTLQVGVGMIADRFGRDLAIGGCMVSSIAGIALLVVGSGLLPVLAGVLLLGIGMGWGAAVFPRFMDHLPGDERGTGFGLIRTVYMVVAASGSVVVGVLASTVGWAGSFLFLTVLLGSVCCLLVGNHWFGLGEPST
jgi:MFS family permease